MKKFILLTLFSIFAHVSHAQVYESEAVNNISKFLTPGKFSYEVLEKDVPADLQDIINRYQKSIADNRDWFFTYRDDNKAKNPLPYHKNFGVSEAEYTRMFKEYRHLKMRVKTTKPINIINEDDNITFKGEDSFTVYDNVKIDRKEGHLYIDGKKLKYKGEVYVGDTSVYGAWSGYKWVLEVGSMEDVRTLAHTDYEYKEINIGKTSLTNKIFLEQKFNLIISGVTQVNADIVGYIKQR